MKERIGVRLHFSFANWLLDFRGLTSIQREGPHDFDVEREY